MQINNYHLLIPVSPDSINTVIMFGKREGDIVILKHKWQKLACLYIEEAIVNGFLPSKFKGRIAVKFKLYFETIRARDGDNYEAMCKGIIDALVVKRLIKDDNASFVDDDGRRLRVDKERPRVELFIREMIKDNLLVTIKEYGNSKLGNNSGRKISRSDQDLM